MIRFAFLLLFAAAALRAQVVETQIAFDSAGKVHAITPTLAARFGLRTPVWPVQNEYVAGRLYSVSTGGHVLVVERSSGVLERHALAPADVTALRDSVNAAAERSGLLAAADQPETASPPARRAFIRNQMLLGLLVYGPLLASLADDAQTGTGLYLLGAGGSYFALTGLARNLNVTRAQNHLATDGALRGWVAANDLLTLLAGDVPDRKTAAAVGLAGAIASSVAGFRYGRPLSDAEAHATTSASSFSALTTAGLLGAFHALDSDNSERGVAGALVAAATAGYLLGVRYPRGAGYNVTAGDVDVLWIGATLGTMVALTPIMDLDVSEEQAFAFATAGMLAGAFAAERGWSRRFDHSGSDVTMMWLGTVAGGLIGGAFVVLTEPEDVTVGMGMVTAGSTIGAIAAQHLIAPAPATSARLRFLRRQFGSAELSVVPMSAAAALAGVRGVHPILTLHY